MPTLPCNTAHSIHFPMIPKCRQLLDLASLNSQGTWGSFRESVQVALPLGLP